MKSMNKHDIIKEFSFAVAAAVLLAGSNLPVSARAPYNDIENLKLTEGGSPLQINPEFECVYFRNLNWERDHDFLAVTTAEGLSDEIADENSKIDFVVEWDEYIETSYHSPDSVNVGLNQGYLMSLKKKYGEDCKIYRVQCEFDTDDMYRTARQFARKYDTVFDTFMLERQNFGKCNWDGTYALVLNAELTEQAQNGTLKRDDLEAMFPDAYEKMRTAPAQYAEKKAAYEAFEKEFSETAKELAKQGYSETDIIGKKMHALTAAGVTSPDSWTMAAIDTATSIYLKYRGQLSAFQPNYEIYSFCAAYRTFSAWDGVGDMNEDGVVNAEDATAILIEAAKGGTGNGTLTKYDAQFADVNSDGIVNAKDATIILCYSAAKGAGSALTLEEYVLQTESKSW